MIARINRTWDELERALAELTDEQLTGPRDAAGWTAKDHLAHLTAWERSMLVLLRDRQPRYAGLGVDQVMYESDDEEAINAYMQARDQHRSLADVQADGSEVHRAMMELLTTRSEDDLVKPCAHYAAGASDEPVYGFINGNTWGHFDLHRPWIVEIISGTN
jgi:hypothetical protein